MMTTMHTLICFSGETSWAITGYASVGATSGSALNHSTGFQAGPESVELFLTKRGWKGGF